VDGWAGVIDDSARECARLPKLAAIIRVSGDELGTTNVANAIVSTFYSEK
jgi:hypothetical protein